MQTYYVTVCREHGTVQEEAVLKTDHLAALAEKEKQIAVLKTTIDVYKQDHVNLLDEIARRGEQIATLKEQIIIQKGMIGWRDGKIREQLEQIATLIARLHTHGDIETDIEALRGEEEE